MLCKGVSWRGVPAEQVGCIGVTAWWRQRDWTEADVRPQLYEVLPAELRGAGLHGTPLAVSLTSGNRHDVMQLMPLLHAIPRIRGLRGRPHHRPGRLFADRGYDCGKYRRLLRPRGITPKIARKGTAHGSGLGKSRWVVERTYGNTFRVHGSR